MKFQFYYVMLTLKLNGVGTMCIYVILLTNQSWIFYYYMSV